ncbi:uncharacterized protein LOC111919606 [Lactuca sativa]|uniref:uncharacterized protein LOC111919606 n=1 Tax=Lactuca sativa TaxID=4236 RepID=UPI0022AE8C0A|nr:uncharacterized protein LOC111919606 [Lactuca sativa]
MLQSINDADKPAPRDKKPEKGKDKKVVKGVKGPSPKKRKSTKAAQSPPPKKRKTHPRRKLILASSSSESEDESSDSEESFRGDSPPCSPSHESLQGAAESNAAKVDSVVEKLATLFALEKQLFAGLRQTLEADNKSFQAVVEERLTKLQEDLASENSVMDALARKTTALKIKSLQLSQSEKEVHSLRSERAVISSCVSDVHGALSNIIEAHDPILNYLVRRTLAEKLAPALALLCKIEGLPKYVSHPKQGGEGALKGENQSQPPPSSTPASTKATEPPTTGHASGSGAQDKGKKALDDSDGDDDKETIADLSKKQAKDKDPDMSARIAREAEANERKMKENSEDDKKYFNDMIQWYIRFRQTILAIIPCLFNTTKKVPAAGSSKPK